MPYYPPQGSGGSSTSAGLMGTGNFLVTWSSDPLLTNERILTAGSSVTITTDANAIYITALTGGGSSIVYAPTGGNYITFLADAALSNEKVLTAGSSVTIHTDATAFYINATTSLGAGSPGGSDTHVQFNDSTAFGGVSAFRFLKTASIMSINSAMIPGVILDANTNELLKFLTVAAASNELSISNNATGNNPFISATGTDTNVGIGLTPKGTGAVIVNATTSQSLLNAGLIINNIANGLPTSDFQVKGDTDPAALYVLVASNNVGFRTATPNSACAVDIAGTLGVRAGSSTAISKTGGVLFYQATTALNAGAAETTLYSVTVPANTLAANGDAVRFYYSGNIATSINNKQLKVKFGATTATTIIDSSAQNPAVATNWIIHGLITRISATSQECSAELSTTGGSLFTFTGEATAAESTSAGTILVITALGGAGGEVTFRHGRVYWEPTP